LTGTRFALAFGGMGSCECMCCIYFGAPSSNWCVILQKLHTTSH